MLPPEVTTGASLTAVTLIVRVAVALVSVPSAREGLRTSGTDAKGRGLTEADDATVIAAMVADPKLIERPLVETEKGVRLGRPPEKVREIL